MKHTLKDLIKRITIKLFKNKKVEPIATKEGRLYWTTKSFFKRKTIKKQIKDLSKSKLVKDIDTKGNTYS